MKSTHQSGVGRFSRLVVIAGAGLLLVLLLAMSAAVSLATVDEPIPSYYSQLRYNLTSPGTYATAIGGYANPGFYGMLPRSETIFSWSDEDALKNWGLFLGGPHIGFGVVRSRIPLGDGAVAGVNDYRFALSGGNKNISTGVAFGWSGGDDGLVGRSQLIQLGYAQRFGRYVSLGLVGNFATQKDYRSGLADLAVRPLGDRLLTVFADYEFATGMSAADAPWSVGAMLDVGPGLEITGRYFENESFAVSVGYNFNSLGLWGSPRFDDNQDHAETVYQVRAGFPKPNILHDVITEDNSYLSMKLKGTVIYRGYKYFDKNRHRFSEIIYDLEHA
ncbi:MAG: hypothetical protein JSW58_17665, partial [Candidatus Latescibacterota bacterium]